MTKATAARVAEKRRRFRLLYRIEAELEPVMFLLAIVWLPGRFRDHASGAANEPAGKHGE